MSKCQFHGDRLILLRCWFLFCFAFSGDILCTFVIGQISECAAVFLVACMGKQHEEKEILFITGYNGCFPHCFCVTDLPGFVSAKSDDK